MKFREAVYLIGTSCFCGLVYLLVASLLGFESRNHVITIPAGNSKIPPAAVRPESESEGAADFARNHNNDNDADASASASNKQKNHHHVVELAQNRKPILVEFESLKLNKNRGSSGIAESVIQFPKDVSADDSQDKSKSSAYPEIVIALVTCGGTERTVQQAITMIKSAILFSKRNRLKIIGFADEKTKDLFTEKILELLVEGQKYLGDSSRLSIEVRPTWFPSENEHEWSQLYAPCSAQRLFFSTMLPTVDALLYLDVDTLILSDLYHIWRYFKRMNNSQYIAMVPEHELPGAGWYNKEATFPYYGPRGLNAGVALMNLTRMRHVKFQEKIHPILLEYNGRLPWGDQDILNIFLHNHTEAVLQLPCQYNYRLNHCVCDYNDSKSCSCTSAEENGISIFHGNKGVFFKQNLSNDPRIQILSTFYQTLRQHNLLNSTPKQLLENVNRNLRNPTPTKSTIITRKKKQNNDNHNNSNSCSNLEHLLLRNLQDLTIEYDIEDHDDQDADAAAAAPIARNNNNENNKNENNDEQFFDFSLENRLEFIED